MDKEYDFFGENESKNSGERIPAPPEEGGSAGNTPSKKGKKIRWQYVVTAISAGIFVFFFGWLGCWLSLDKQMRALVDVKKTVQAQYYKEVTDEEFYAAVFDGVNGKLLDDYSEYMTAEEFAAYMEEMQGNRVGVGLVFTSEKDAPLKALRVCSGSPAESAGILRGETIKGIGSAPESLTRCATFQEFSDLLEGYGEKEDFFLLVEDKLGAERVVCLHKAAYVENVLFYQTKDVAYTFVGDSGEKTASGAPLSYLDEDTACIQLLSFTGNAKVAFDTAMGIFKEEGKKNLVLDLRGNGGGYLDVMQSIASYFCKTATENKPVVAVADYGERRVEYRANGNYYDEYFSEDSKITLLADSGSASASECLIGCMLDYEAVAYGDICLIERGGVAKTFGKGIMQETYILNLFEQNALKLTTAEIRWPKGNSIHGRGVKTEDGAKVVIENADYDIETQTAIEKVFE